MDRQWCGLQLVGEPALQHLVNCHFTSRALGSMMLSGLQGAGPSSQQHSGRPGGSGSGRPAMLYFVFNSQVVAVLVAHDLRAGEFVAQVGYLVRRWCIIACPGGVDAQVWALGVRVLYVFGRV